MTLSLKNIIKFTKLNPEPTAKGSVLKFDKVIYSKSINSEWGTSPHSSEPDMAIIVRSIVLAFRFAQGVQSSLTLGRNIIVMLIIYQTVSSLNDLTEPTGEGRFLPIVYAHQFYSPRPPTHASLTLGVGSAWANWLA